MASPARPGFVSLAGSTLVASVSMAASSITSTYVGPDLGFWNDVANWNAGIPMNAGGTTFVAAIPSPLLVQQDINVTIDGVDIEPDAYIVVLNGRSLTLAAPLQLNDGDLRLGSTGALTDLKLNSDVVFDGIGYLELFGSVNNRVYGTNAVRRLTNNEFHSIYGIGQFGANTSLHLTNNGYIESGTSATLTIDLVGTSSDNFNNGLILSNPGGTLVLQGTAIDNTLGELYCSAGSTFNITNSTVVGGLLACEPTGNLAVVSTGILIDPILQGTLRVPNGQVLDLKGTVLNLDLIAVQSAAANTDVRLSGDALLTGGGMIELQTGTGNRIYGTGTPRRLTNADDHTIKGVGQLGANLFLLLSNQGLIQSGSSGTLTIDLAGTVADNFNLGLIEAVAGGTVAFQGTQLDNTRGTVQATAGGAVSMANSQLHGGVLLVEPGGTATFQSGTVLDEIELVGTARVPNGQALEVTDSLVNDGILSLQSTGSVTELRLAADTAFSGFGAVELLNVSTNRIVGSTMVRRLANGPDHTIRGIGQLGANTLLTLANAGTVAATDGTTLTVDLVGTSLDNTNTGLFVAHPLGTLVVQGTELDNTGGLLYADTGGNLTIANSTIAGGDIASAPGGDLSVSGVAKLVGTGVEGTLRVPNGQVLEIADTITDDGTVLVQSAGSPTDLRVVADATLDGAGRLDLSGPTARVYGSGGTRTLTNGPAHTIAASGSGGGQLGLDTQLNLVNQGWIDVSEASLTIDPTTTFANQGTTWVGPGQTLTLGSGTTSTSGLLEVDGTLAASAATLVATGGTVSGDGTIQGSLAATGGFVAPGSKLGVLTIQGSLSLSQNGGLEAVVADYDRAGPTDRLVVTGQATLGGTLAVSLAPGFRPAPSDEFTILSCASRSGTFSSVAGCEAVDVIYGATSVKVRFTGGSTSSGPDLNGDGVVNAADLAILLGAWGPCPNPCCAADLDGDGQVSASDLAILLGAWG